MTINAEVLRCRRTRERIFHLLMAAHKGMPGVAIAHEQILEAFANDRTRYTQEEIEGALLDLIEDKLVTQENAPWGTPPEKLYKLTSQGRDFTRAKFPWGRIDEFTGGQTLG